MFTNIQQDTSLFCNIFYTYFSLLFTIRLNCLHNHLQSELKEKCTLVTRIMATYFNHSITSLIKRKHALHWITQTIKMTEPPHSLRILRVSENSCFPFTSLLTQIPERREKVKKISYKQLLPQYEITFKTVYTISFA